MFSFEQMALLHRHENDWRELREVTHPTPDDEDLERRILRGERVFRCADCDEQIVVVPSAAT